KTEPSTTLRVAPLASHDVILGMPFLVRNNLLVDPVSRSVVPREDIILGNSDETDAPASPIPNESLETRRQPRVKGPRLPIVTDQIHFVKVGNALMQVSEGTARSVHRHICRTSAKPASIVTHQLTVRLACCVLADEFESKHKELHAAFVKQYPDVFSTELPSQLPPK